MNLISIDILISSLLYEESIIYSVQSAHEIIYTKGTFVQKCAKFKGYKL